MNNDTKTVFYNPFEGRPIPLQLVGLCMFHPEVYLKLSGHPIQAAYAENGLAPQYRRIQRSLRGETKLSAGLKACKEVIGKLPHEMSNLFRKAFDGDKVCINQLESLSLFETLFLGMQFTPDSFGLEYWFAILLERVGTAAWKQASAGDISEAARSIAEHPLLHHLLWSEALAAFEQVPTTEALGPLRVSIYLEAHLAWLAAWDLNIAKALASNTSSFTCLIPSDRHPSRNPTSLFFDELQRRLGAKSIADILDTSSGSQVELEKGTLDRWSAGTHFPDIESVTKLLTAYDLKKENDILYAQLICSKHLHLLGDIGEKMSNHARQAGMEKGHVLWPWPSYPHGYPSFEAWANARYQHWFKIFTDRGDELPSLARLS